MQISGIEINDSQISILSLKRRGNSLMVSGFAKKDLPAGVIKKGIVVKPEALASVLKELKHTAKPKKNIFILCNSCSTRRAYLSEGCTISKFGN